MLHGDIPGQRKSLFKFNRFRGNAILRLRLCQRHSLLLHHLQVGLRRRTFLGSCLSLQVSLPGTISDANLVLVAPVNLLASALFAFGTWGYLDHAHVLGGILSQDIEKVKDIVFICA